jgi:exonuclease VII small subunit
MNVLQAIGQAIDFVWKASQEYAQTEHGQKELNDVIQALEFGEVSPDEQLNSFTQNQQSVSRQGRNPAKEG